MLTDCRLVKKKQVLSLLLRGLWCITFCHEFSFISDNSLSIIEAALLGENVFYFAFILCILGISLWLHRVFIRKCVRRNIVIHEIINNVKLKLSIWTVHIFERKFPYGCVCLIIFSHLKQFSREKPFKVYKIQLIIVICLKNARTDWKEKNHFDFIISDKYE